MKAFESTDPGKLDRRITLLSPVETRDAAGGAVTSWVNVATVWAEFTPQPGREIQQAGQKIALAAAMFRIRYRSDIGPKWRLMFGSTVYELTAPPVEVGRHVYLDLVALALERTDLTIDGVGVQARTIDLAEGDETKAFTYLTAFASSPTAVYVSVLPPSGGYVITATVLDATRTAAGATAQLGATIPGPGYKLSIIAIL